MSTDTILKAVARGDGRALRPEDERLRWSLDSMNTQKWLDGHVPGARAAVGWLKDRAIQCFQGGRDSEAQFLRETAAEMEKQLLPILKASAERFGQDHPSLLLESADGTPK